MRKNYILVLDTETANTVEEKGGKLNMSDALFYDIGWAVIDRFGTVYETASYINRDIFVYEWELMKTAYYAKKIPQYLKELRDGTRKMATLYEIRTAIMETISKYKIKNVCAHNARFDCNALNRTQQYITKSKYRSFFPFDSVVWWDSLRMARSVIAKMPTYIKYCEKNNYLTKQGKPRLTAEILYRFISKNDDFIEAHTGLEDVLIEKEIVAYCFRQHKKMDRELYPNRKKFPVATDFQMEFFKNLKEFPVLSY